MMYRNLKTTHKTMTRKEYIHLVIAGKINTDPLGQRPPVTNKDKSLGIIDASLQGLGQGAISLRDITNDKLAQQTYKGYDQTVIDGGHRSRNWVDFFDNILPSSKGFFKDLSSNLRNQWLNDPIILEIYECTSRQARDIFRAINSSTPVNDIEMLMSDESSELTKLIRSQTKTYEEYEQENQKNHEIFDIDIDKAKYFQDKKNNPRRKWDEWVATAIGMIITDDVVDYDILNKLVDNQELEITSTHKNKLQEFLDFAFKCRPKHHYTGIKFYTVMCAWFNKPQGKILNYKEFSQELWRALSCMTYNSDHYYNEDARANNKRMLQNSFNRDDQRKAAELLYSHMNLSEEVFNTSSRTLALADRITLLEMQKCKCYIDGEDLDIKDAEYGHDVPYSKGGDLKGGRMIRKIHNQKMGNKYKLEEYKKIWEQSNGA